MSRREEMSVTEARVRSGGSGRSGAIAPVSSPSVRIARAPTKSRLLRFACLDDLPIGIALAVNLFALDQRDFTFDASLGEVDLGRNEGQALLAPVSFQPIEPPAEHE